MIGGKSARAAARVQAFAGRRAGGARVGQLRARFSRDPAHRPSGSVAGVRMQYSRALRVAAVLERRRGELDVSRHVRTGFALCLKGACQPSVGWPTTLARRVPPLSRGPLNAQKPSEPLMILEPQINL
jgi:hypothetical protein